MGICLLGAIAMTRNARLEVFLKELPDSNTAKAYRRPYGSGITGYTFKDSSNFYQLTQNMATNLTGIYLNNACFVQNPMVQIPGWNGKMFVPFFFSF